MGIREAALDQHTESLEMETENTNRLKAIKREKL